MPKLEEIEDIDDIDNLDMDLAELDSSLKTPIAPRIVPQVVRSQDQEEEPPLFPGQATLPSGSGPTSFSFINPETGKIEKSTKITQEDLEELKCFQILYPCYFDKKRSHKQGRRVPTSLAVENPLAKTIADAVRELNMLCVFEGEKCHPQDFGNPGRVRVLLKEEGKPVSPERFLNKRTLMKKVAEYMQAHPTSLQSLREIPYGPDFEGVEPKKVPLVKGFNMNQIVPLHSAFLMGHPMTKSIYEAPVPVPTEKQPKIPKNRYKVVRR